MDCQETYKEELLFFSVKFSNLSVREIKKNINKQCKYVVYYKYICIIDCRKIKNNGLQIISPDCCFFWYVCLVIFFYVQIRSEFLKQ